MRPSQDKVSFDVLNGLRGIAAIAVVNTHLQGYFAGYYSHNVSLVVDFFFVLSGFVIAHAYGERLRIDLSPMKFLGARLIRLYPLYLAGLVIGAAVLWFNWNWAGVPKFFATLGAGLLMLPTPPAISSNGYNSFPFNFPAWSLFFELVANLVFALFARRLSNRVLAILIGLSLIGLAIVGHLAGTLDLGVRPQGFAGGLARVMFSFFVGVALYRLWLVRPLKINVPAILLFALLILPLLLSPAEGAPQFLYDLAVITIYFPILVFVGAQSRVNAFWTKVCAFLGAVSYPLYVLHAPIWDSVKVHYDKALVGAAPWSGVVFVAALVVVAWVCDVWLDRPLRRFLTRKLLHRRAVEKAPIAF